ncbi:MAG TPA: biotin/lipoyl-binding protein, partial [bacterium]|nr:biotin/lipoyl-binding protein [bacterium]
MSKTTPAPAAPANNDKRTKILRGLLAVGLLAAAYFGYQTFRYEGTDDAYVEAHTVMLAPRIGGVVEKVLVKENEKVKAGQVLAELDAQDYATAYDQAAADAEAVRADLAAAAQDYQ